ncbi:hypothetical protein Taro_003781 [Colocasia esculenta]|uniref:Uncharacterized protein n=1 Tax=Colocasia esculenta TaxID=4460 RepID=A0A843TI59_COLES|nr:hypothetical protein [Colocasia esculenta]
MAPTAASIAASCSQSAFLFQPLRSSRLPPSVLPRACCHRLPLCSLASANRTPCRLPILASPLAGRSWACDPLRAVPDSPGSESGEAGLAEDASGGGGAGGEGYGGGGGSSGGGDGEWKEGGGGAEGGGEGKEMGGGMSMSQKITLAYATLVGVGGLMGYLKGGSQKSLAAGGLSALLLYFVYTQLPVKPAFASSLGLGLSAALLAVMGSRFRKSGKIFPAGVVSIVSFIMVGGYAHGVMRSLHGVDGKGNVWKRRELVMCFKMFRRSVNLSPMILPVRSKALSSEQRLLGVCRNLFDTSNTSLHQPFGGKPCLRAPSTEQQVWLTEQATCSVPSAQKNPSSPSFPRGGYNGYATRAPRSSGALTAELLNGRLNA